MNVGGTYPDLAMTKGLELARLTSEYDVKSSSSKDVNELKRAVHQNLFVSVGMVVTKDIYKVTPQDFVYKGDAERAGGH